MIITNNEEPAAKQLRSELVSDRNTSSIEEDIEQKEDENCCEQLEEEGNICKHVEEKDAESYSDCEESDMTYIESDGGDCL